LNVSWFCFFVEAKVGRKQAVYLWLIAFDFESPIEKVFYRLDLDFRIGLIMELR